MSEKICDNKSVGVLVKYDGRVLIIERKKFPAGFALPAGHLDGDSFLDGARRELKEETGVDTGELKLILEDDLPNPCRRQGGTHHQWQIFGTTAFSEDLKRSEDETKSAEWAKKERLENLARRTEEFAEKHNTKITDLTALTKTLSEDPKWQASPGLEPVWYMFLKKLGEV